MSRHIAPGEPFIAIYLRYGPARKAGIYRKVYRDKEPKGKVRKGGSAAAQRTGSQLELSLSQGFEVFD